MNGFIFEREDCDSLSLKTVSFRKIRVDSKGRISIPSDLRKNLGLESGSYVLLGFDLEKSIIFLVCGQGSVVVNMGDCGSPDAGSNPAPDPENNLIDTNKISNR